jgi:alpha-1,3-rhamnosyl/mannosyltransferase
MQVRPSRVFATVNERLRLRKERSFWAELRTGIYLSTYYTTNPGIRIPEVSIVHDVIFELFPDATVGLRQDSHKADRLRSIAAASAIICPSESACSDLHEYFTVDQKVVRVIPWGIERWFRQTQDESMLNSFRLTRTQGAPYILYVGGRSGTKNFVSLLVAFSRWRPGKDISLLAVGGGAFSNEENCLLRALNVRGRVHCIPALTNGELVVAYSAALGCVVPSLYEGFGFPALEAISCGTPVACSRVSSLPEVGGESSHYFDPCSQDELVAALDALVDTDRNSNPFRRDVARAQLRDWDVVASEYEAVFREIV